MTAQSLTTTATTLVLALMGAPAVAETPAHGSLSAPTGIAAFIWAQEVALAPLNQGAFGPAEHERIARDLAQAGGCSETLAQEMWRAEATLAGRTDAARHFLNGALGPGIAYVQQQAAQVGTALSQQNVPGAAASLGRALHATQSFYANTNYVELQHEMGLTFAQVPLFQPWMPDAEERVSELIAKGLIAGCDPLLTRPACGVTDLSRATIEKRPATPAGERDLQGWSKSAYRAAIELAERTSMELIRTLTQRFPALARYCAPTHSALLVPIAISAGAMP